MSDEEIYDLYARVKGLPPLKIEEHVFKCPHPRNIFDRCRCKGTITIVWSNHKGKTYYHNGEELKLKNGFVRCPHCGTGFICTAWGHRLFHDGLFIDVEKISHRVLVDRGDTTERMYFIGKRKKKRRF